MSQSERTKLIDFLKVSIFRQKVSFNVIEEQDKETYRELLVCYASQEGDEITAYLLLPKRQRLGPAVLIHHQHNDERHLGKSEVIGKKGNPLQAFGPALAEKGFVVLAHDSICFEDRRSNRRGTEPDAEADWQQHYREMTYRLVAGDTLMRKVLNDASIGLSLLLGIDGIDSSRVGVLGHSYGGNTALFQAAIDDRVQFICSSGAVCSYRRKVREKTGLEMALVVPGFCEQFEIESVVNAISPRSLLVVSATEDEYSKDADEVVMACSSAFPLQKAITHFRYYGGHDLTKERFNEIVEWVAKH